VASKALSSTGAQDDTAERAEYGIPDQERMELERDRFGSFAENQEARASEEELEEFKPPRDQAP
jgi:hypothetical protein